MAKGGRIERNRCRRITGMITPITDYKIGKIPFSIQITEFITPITDYSFPHYENRAFICIFVTDPKYQKPWIKL